jgi:hypothetical protein
LFDWLHGTLGNYGKKVNSDDNNNNEKVDLEKGAENLIIYPEKV